MSSDTVPAGPVRLAYDDLMAAELAAQEVLLLVNTNRPLDASKVMYERLRPRLTSAVLRLHGELVMAGVKI